MWPASIGMDLAAPSDERKDDAPASGKRGREVVQRCFRRSELTTVCARCRAHPLGRNFGPQTVVAGLPAQQMAL